MQKEMWNELP